jgi:Tat-targeted selenate reductase subunit YnfE
VNCGGACVLQCHVKDGHIDYVESDNTGSSDFGDIQARACLRGRSIRRWIDHADRLNYPMKRVEGTKRGEGKYERITWDEALDTIASEFTRITKAYGNESVFIQECSGVEQNIMQNNPFFRLFNLCGGVLTRYGNYSNAALNFGAIPYTYGKSWGNRSFKTLQQDELVVLFGNTPMDTRMGGDGAGYDINVACEQKNVRVICIDPRRSEIATNRGAEWIPIAPGTDAALVAGLAHELIANNLVDLNFLHTYCVGYDEETLPEGAPANSSYYAYVMGTGYDKVEKTPA